MRHTTFSLTVIAACATGAATIAALAANAAAAAPGQLAPVVTHHVQAPVKARGATGAHSPKVHTPMGASHAPSSTGSTGTRQLKPQLTGVLNRQGVPPAAYRAAEGGYDIQGTHDAQGRADVGDVTWAELQPTAGGPITTNNAIDQAILDVRAWNAANPTHPEALKLRVEAGIHSPAWAVNLGGSCVTVTDPTSGTTGCSPRFWTAQFSAAYYHFEAQLAAKYDNVAEIREVDMAKNTTVYNESMIRQTQSPSTVAALLGAGYTTVVDELQQTQDIASLGAYWKHTLVGFAFNPYQTANPITQDEAFTQLLIASGRHALGAQLVLENNSLRQSYLTGRGAYQTMYAYMTSVGGPIGFQTATLLKVGSIQAVVNGAAAMGGTSLELPTGYQSQCSPAQLMALGLALT
jgi:hypothetical protein